MKRAREEEEASAPPAPAPAQDAAQPPPAPTPAIAWVESYGSRVVLARAEALRGGSIEVSTRCGPLAPAEAADLLAACAGEHGCVLAPIGAGAPGAAAGALALRRCAWLPPALSRPTITVGFPSVRLGNRLFIYGTARLAAACLGRTLELLTPDKLMAKSLPARAAYGPGDVVVARGQGGGWEVGTHPGIPVGDARYLPPLPLAAFLRAQAVVGREWVNCQPSTGTAGALFRPLLPLLATWYQKFCLAALTASLRATRHLGSGEGDWVVHVRAGDTWVDERGRGSGAGGGRVNSAAHCPPPVWWYTASAQRFSMRRVWLVSESSASSLVEAVEAALRRGGVAAVQRVSSSEEADWGTLLRARNLVMSNSTFVWWAAALAQFVPAVYSRTIASLEAKDAAAAAAGAAGAAAAGAAPFFPPPGTPVRVLQALTGHSRPGSCHAVHADIFLQSSGPLDFVDPSAAEPCPTPAPLSRSVGVEVHTCRVWSPAQAEALEAYSCSMEQARWVLETEVPEWARGEEVWGGGLG